MFLKLKEGKKEREYFLAIAQEEVEEVTTVHVVLRRSTSVGGAKAF